MIQYNETLYDSRRELHCTVNPILGRKVGCYVIRLVAHAQFPDGGAEIQTDMPELTAGSTVKFLPLGEAKKYAAGANARAAQRCRELAEQLLEHAEALEAETATVVEAKIEGRLLELGEQPQ